MLTVKEAAKRLGLTPGRIYQLINRGIIPASRFGNAWTIQEQDLNRAKWNRVRGLKGDCVDAAAAGKPQ